MEIAVITAFVLSLCAFFYHLGKFRGVKSMLRIMSRQNHPSFVWSATAGSEASVVTINGVKVN